MVSYQQRRQVQRLWCLGVQHTIRARSSAHTQAVLHGRFPIENRKSCHQPFSSWSMGPSPGVVSRVKNVPSIVQKTNPEPQQPSASDIFVAATAEAQRLSDLASKFRFLGNESKKMPDAELQSRISNAGSAACALLTSTNHFLVIEDSIRLQIQTASSSVNDETSATKSQVAALHRAFVSVTGWCLDIIPHDSSGNVLEQTLELGRRASELQLPFPLPLYQRLVVAVAKHAKAEVLCDQMLEVSSWTIQEEKGARGGGGLSIHFFSEAFCAVVERKLWKNATDLLNGIKTRHSIKHVDMDILYPILSQMKHYPSATDFLEDNYKAEDYDQLVELFNMLDPPVFDDIQSSSPKEDEDNTSRVIPTSPSRSKLPSREELDKIVSELPWGEELGDFFDDLEEDDDFIYQRKGEALPDVTAQLNKLSGCKITYSEEFERILLERILTDDSDDDDDFVGLYDDEQEDEDDDDL